MRWILLGVWMCGLVACDGGSTDTDATTHSTTTTSETGSQEAETSVETTGESETGGPPKMWTPCEVSPALPDGDAFDQTLVRLTPDGTALYIATDESEVRRYLIEPGEPCQLTLDESFGTGGVIAATVSDMAVSDSAVVVTHEDNTAGAQQIWPSPGSCSPETQLAHLAASPTEDAWIASYYEGPLQGFNASGSCAYTEKPGFTYEGLTPKGLALLPDGSVHMSVSGDIDENGVPEHGVLRFAADGTRAGTYGSLVSAIEPDGFCLTDSITLCGEDVCTHDPSCWRIKRFAANGEYIGSVATDPLRKGDGYAFVETSVTSNPQGVYLYVGGGYNAGGRGVFRIGI